MKEICWFWDNVNCSRPIIENKRPCLQCDFYAMHLENEEKKKDLKKYGYVSKDEVIK